ncbi:MAG: dockerin type I repeat-containing protein [Firmicutes bacterium]|nr:dockerin type I repeat-containing protein [Bacillota bacterium]
MKAKVTVITGLILALLPLNVYAADIYGDADNNGVVDAQDASYTLNHVLNSEFEIDEILADADADGKITAADASMIMQKVLVSTFGLAKEKKDPAIGLVSEISELPYGVYTKSFNVGDITVSASKSSPVYVKDVCISDDWGEKTYEKAMVMTKGSGLACDMQSSLYEFSIGFLFINDSDYAAEIIAPCDENGESLESPGYYSEQDKDYEHIWYSWKMNTAHGCWENNGDKPVLIQSAKMLKIK